MSEQDHSQERTEQATPKRKAELQRRGHVLRSKEWSTLLVVMSAVFSTIAFEDEIFDYFKAMIVQTFTLNRRALFDDSILSLALLHSLKFALLSILPIFCIVVICVIAGNLVFGSNPFSSGVLAPKWSRINPVSGLKRIFSMNSLMELFKAIIKVTVILLIAYWVISYHWESLMLLSGKSLPMAMAEGISLLHSALILFVMALVLVSLIDIPYQLYRFVQDGLMTKQEVRDEYKETEGKPEVKSRIRRMQREIAKRRMMSRLAEADVVIANPEHYAVAIIYDRATMRAPIVVAKGLDLIALKIKAKAKEHRVALIEAPPLARALYYSTELEEPIPNGLYVAVAQVLAYVYQLKRFEKGEVYDKPTLKNLPIPDELKR